MMESLKRAVLDALFPPHCIGCGKGRAMICPRCEAGLTRHVPPYCSVCSKPTGEKDKRVKGEKGNDEKGVTRLCYRCARAPLAIDGIRSVFVLEGTVREGVHRLKYRGLRSLAAPLGAHLGNYLLANPFPVDAIVPVPLHKRRLRERGYNQSALLAREAARLTGLKLVEDALVRVKDTPAQVRTMSAEERRRNMQGAFRAEKAHVEGMRILVVDDVCTTGSTLEACSLALREAGANSVWGMALAREV